MTARATLFAPRGGGPIGWPKQLRPNRFSPRTRRFQQSEPHSQLRPINYARTMGEFPLLYDHGSPEIAASHFAHLIVQHETCLTKREQL